MRRRRARTRPVRAAGPRRVAGGAALGRQRGRGRLIENHPLDALKELVDEIDADEVIVLTDPHYVEEFFHRDWASRARHKVGVPVLKLFSHSKV